MELCHALQDLIKGNFTNPDESNTLDVGMAIIREDDSDYEEWPFRRCIDLSGMDDMVLRGLATNIGIWGQLVAEIQLSLVRLQLVQHRNRFRRHTPMNQLCRRSNHVCFWSLSEGFFSASSTRPRRSQGEPPIER
jgi:hypothetical protein